MKQYLKTINSKKLYEIYSNFDDIDKFLVGYVVAKDNQFILIDEIDTYGNQDGWCCLRLDEIIQYKTNTKYLKTIELLNVYNGNNRRSFALENPQEVLFSFLSFIKANHKVCSFELCNSKTQDIIGYIENIDKKTNTAIVKNIDNYGQKDGESIVDLSMVSSVEFDNLDTKKIDILYSLNNKK